jgi:hypothetical protein
MKFYLSDIYGAAFGIKTDDEEDFSEYLKEAIETAREDGATVFEAEISYE